MNERDQRYRRRWFQISLRSLFLLTLIVAAYFAGYRTAVRQAEQTQRTEREARHQAERETRELLTLTLTATEQTRLENRLLAMELDRTAPNWRSVFDSSQVLTHRSRFGP